MSTNVQPRSRGILVTLPSVILFSTKNLPHICSNLGVYLSFFFLHSCAKKPPKQQNPQVVFWVLLVFFFSYFIYSQHSSTFPEIMILRNKKQSRYDKRPVGRQMTFSKYIAGLWLLTFLNANFLHCSKQINRFPTVTLSIELPFDVPSLPAKAE